jgi:uncharacterized protein
MAVIIFKAVERCNSNCMYCNVIKKPLTPIMDLALLETVFLRINEYLEVHERENIDFTWHGGEVCLLGADYFKRALEFQHALCARTSSRIRHLVQSNLTIITKEILDAFKALGVDQIGSSFDPVPHIRGFGKDRDSDEYNRRFFDGVNLLEENGFGWGVICVVHRQSLPLAIDLFYYLNNLNFRFNPHFNPVVVFGETPSGPLAITPMEFAHFLGAIFPLWWEHRDRYPNVKPFLDYVKAATHPGVSMACGHSGGCANNWVYIGPSGDTSQCSVAGEYGYVEYGSIRDRSLMEILGDAKREQFRLRQAWLPQSACLGCRFWGLCHGGCPMEAVVGHNDVMKPSPQCATVKTFLEQYFEPITGLRIDAPPTHENAFARA